MAVAQLPLRVVAPSEDQARARARRRMPPTARDHVPLLRVTRLDAEPVAPCRQQPAAMEVGPARREAPPRRQPKLFGLGGVDMDALLADAEPAVRALAPAEEPRRAALRALHDGQRVVRARRDAQH
eukprot:7090540-Prymnesium_polylepis.1